MQHTHFDLGTAEDLVPEAIYLMIEEEIAEIITSELFFDADYAASGGEVEQAA